MSPKEMSSIFFATLATIFLWNERAAVLADCISLHPDSPLSIKINCGLRTAAIFSSGNCSPISFVTEITLAGLTALQIPNASNYTAVDHDALCFAEANTIFHPQSLQSFSSHNHTSILSDTILRLRKQVEKQPQILYVSVDGLASVPCGLNNTQHSRCSRIHDAITTAELFFPESSIPTKIIVAEGYYENDCLGPSSVFNTNVEIFGAGMFSSFVDCSQSDSNGAFYSTSAFLSIYNLGIESSPIAGLQWSPNTTGAQLTLHKVNIFNCSTSLSANISVTQVDIQLVNSVFTGAVLGAVNIVFHNESIGSSTNVVNSSFSGNTGVTGGICLFIDYTLQASSSTVTLSSVQFQSNTLSGSAAGTLYGGAVLVQYKGAAHNCSVTASDESSFQYNLIQSGGNFAFGGALSVYYRSIANYSSVILSGASFLSNLVQMPECFGGAVSIVYNSSAYFSVVTITNSLFQQNGNNNNNMQAAGNVTFNGGGALFVSFKAGVAEYSTITIADTEFISNSNVNMYYSQQKIINYGGAVFINFDPSLSTIFNCSVALTSLQFYSNSNKNVLNGGPFTFQPGLHSNSGGAVVVVVGGTCTACSFLVSNSRFINNMNQNNGIGDSNNGAALMLSFERGLIDSFVRLPNISCSSNINKNTQLAYADGAAAENWGGCIALTLTGCFTSYTEISVSGGFFADNFNQNLNGQRSGTNAGGAISILLFSTVESLLFYNNSKILIADNVFSGNINVNSVVSGIVPVNTNVNFGGAVACTISSGLTSYMNLSLSGNLFTQNKNRNENCGSFNSNFGGGASIVLSGNVYNSSVTVNDLFKINENLIQDSLNGNENSGGGFGMSVFGQNERMEVSVRSNFERNSNTNLRNDDGNTNIGGGGTVNCSSCVLCSIRLEGVVASNNVNLEDSNHLGSSNLGGGVLAHFDQLSAGATIYVVGGGYTDNSNMMKSSIDVLQNLGGGLVVQALGANGSFLIANVAFEGNSNDATSSQSEMKRPYSSQGSSLLTSPAGAINNCTFAFVDEIPSTNILNNMPSSLLCAGHVINGPLSVKSSTCTLACSLPIEAIVNGVCVTPSPSSSSNNLSIGICAVYSIAIVLGSLVVLISLFFWGRWFYRRTRRKYERVQDSLRESLLINDRERGQLQNEVETLKKAWEISWNDLIIERQIGSGAFGVVYSGKWRDLRVAIKIVGAVLHAQDGSTVTNPFSAEVDKEVSMLQTVRHPNIVLFFGAGENPDGATFLVTELIDLGTLAKVLHETSNIHWRQKTDFALDTARGMAHVHSLGRMHRDLKSSNLLVSSSWRVKVADFGTASLANLTQERAPDARVGSSGVMDNKLDSQDSRLRTKGVGTPLWMAPEILQGNPYGFGADVYSYGVVLWEIASQDIPWRDVPSRFILSNLLTRILAEQRPPCDASWPIAYVQLLQACWATSPDSRPTFTSIIDRLTDFDFKSSSVH